MPLCIYPYGFIHNNFYRQMHDIIKAAYGRPRIKFKTAEHHIVPKSFDPSLEFEPWNIVNLTHQEHYEVHQLLPHCVPEGLDQEKMIVAAFLQSHQNNVLIDKITYAKLREYYAHIVSKQSKERWECPEYSENQKKKREQYWSNPENKDIHSRRRKERGYKHSLETKKKLGDAKRGTKLTPEHKKNLSRARKILLDNPNYISPTKGQKRSEQTRQRIIQSKSIIWWKATSPSGEEFIFKNLAEFCRLHNLSQGHMVGIANGRKSCYQHKGWKCSYIDPPTSELS